MPRLILFLVALAAAAQTLQIPLRSRPKALPMTISREVPVKGTAVVVCDMWDRHWCTGATQRVAALVKTMDPLLSKLRATGVPIIHAPSETMDFYKDYPQRKAMLALPLIVTPPPLDHIDPPLPIDDKSGGCDTHDKFYKAWTRENPGLTIGPNDLISDNGREIYSFLQSKGIGTVLVMGVHTNMCVLNRSFAIKQLTRWGISCILVRDMTDSMYDPQDKPYVPHDQGTQLVIEYIEKYWAPSTTSTELLSALR